MGALPKTIGGTADRLFRLRTKRLAAEKKINAMKAEESELKGHAVQLLQANRLDAGRGKLATVTRNTKAIPTVEDWDELYAFIKKEDAFELLQRRPALGAFRERWDNEETVPGVKRDSIIELSLTKAPKK